MKNFILTIVLLCSAIGTYAQEETSKIHYDNTLTWEEITQIDGEERRTGVKNMNGKWIVPLTDKAIVNYRDVDGYYFFIVTIFDSDNHKQIYNLAGEKLLDSNRYQDIFVVNNQLKGAGPKQYEVIEFDLNKLKVKDSTLKHSVNNNNKFWYASMFSGDYDKDGNLIESSLAEYSPYNDGLYEIEIVDDDDISVNLNIVNGEQYAQENEIITRSKIGLRDDDFFLREDTTVVVFYPNGKVEVLEFDGETGKAKLFYIFEPKEAASEIYKIRYNYIRKLLSDRINPSPEYEESGDEIFMRILGF